MAKHVADVAANGGQNENHEADRAGGLRFGRYFTPPGSHAYDLVEWERRTAAITNEKGAVIFEQRDVEVPRAWSQLATNVVAQKYFRGHLGSPDREHSARQLIDRVVTTIGRWGREGGYFATEDDAANWEEDLRWLLVTQHASFNSPVWFNIGVPARAQQASACQPYRAMVSTPEGMVPIGRIVEGGRVGAEVFDADGVTRVVAVKANGQKRVLKVRLKNGSFIEATPDHVVLAMDTIRGGTRWTRVDELVPGMRLCLHAHRAKVAQRLAVTAGSGSMEIAQGEATTTPAAVSEAALAGWLQADGFVGQYSGTNRSLTIEFQVVNDEEQAWVEHHLDVVFPDVHRHVTDVPSLDPNRAGSVSCRRVRLYGEVLREFVDRWQLRARGRDIQVPDLLWTASHDEMVAYLRSVFQSDGYVSVRRSRGYQAAKVGLGVISERWTEDLQLLLLSLGIYSRRTVAVERRENRSDLHVLAIGIGSERARFAELVGFVDRRKQSRLLESLELRDPRTCVEVREEFIVGVDDLGMEDVYDIQTESGNYLTNNVVVHNCFINSVEDTMESILELAKTEGMLFKFGSGTGTNLSVLRSSKEHLAGGGTASGPVSFMRGYDSFAGSIKSGGTTRRAAKMVILNADHPDVLEFVRCKADEEKKAWALIEAGYDPGFNVPGGAYDSVQFQNANHSVRVTDEFMRAVEQDGQWTVKAVTDGRPLGTYRAREVWQAMADAAWICGDPGVQFDTTIQDWNCVPNTGRINATNPCSEFVFVDDTACNLLSLNLLKYQDSGGRFNVERLRHAVDVCFTAQEILVSNASYPTPAIGANSERLRPLGLGYANLGALLMSLGMAYDSDEGRRYAGAITAIMTGRAYAQSARMSAVKGPFEDFEKNRVPMLSVMAKHRAAAYALPTGGEADEVVHGARAAWDEAVTLGERHGYRNAQSTVIAPTGCLVGDSLVMTDRGLVRLQRLGDPEGRQWQGLLLTVATDEGPRRATKYYVNGAEPVVTVETGRGYRIQGTATHRIKVVDEAGAWQWRRLADVRPGDRVPLMLGGMVGEPRLIPLPPLGESHWNSGSATVAPRQVSAELAELAGYFMGDGSLHARGLRLCVAASDRDVVERLRWLARALFGVDAAITEKRGYIEVALHSVDLAMWWEACGLAKHMPADGRRGKGHTAHVPDAVLATNDPAVYSAFLRGLFESDGSMTTGYVSFSTTSERFARDVQTIMLALGMVTTLRVEQAQGDRWGKATRYVVRMLNQASGGDFARRIGFMSARKRALNVDGDHPQAARFDHVPVSRALVDQLVPENDGLRKTMLLSLSRTGTVSRRAATRLLERTHSIALRELLRFFYDTVASSRLGDEEYTFDLSVPENVTYVANGFVSHNTIGLMMDCDTTGIEPDLALVKYKKLVGGGLLKIVNGTVPQALRRLEYAEDQVKDIVEYIDEHDTIEGAPHLQDRHLRVFDCAFKPLNGVRSIAPMGHVRMMAAVQPFVSGSQSKTVNLPHEATVDDIANTYLESWKLGLKCIAIYRDGCKRSQPLSTSRSDDTAKDRKAPAAEAAAEPRPVRRHLPDERRSLTHKFDIQGHEGYVTVGLYDDGTPGEIFLTMAKEGSTISGLMDAFALQTSMALQYGVPLRKMVNKFSHVRFEPSGFTKNPEIPIAKSLMDYIFRWLASRFLDAEDRDAVGILRREPAEATATPDPPAPEPPQAPRTNTGNSNGTVAGGAQKLTFVANADSPACPDCGSITVRSGACYKCMNCGSTTGCG